MIKENCTYTEFNGVMEAVSTDKGKLSVLQGTFKTIINSVSKFLTKDSRAKLLDKGIEASHGDITKITQINETTWKCLAILKKSKNSETKLDVKQAEALYTFECSYCAGSLAGKYMAERYVRKKNDT